jgi:hypothetical protein
MVLTIESRFARMRSFSSATWAGRSTIPTMIRASSSADSDRFSQPVSPSRV